MKPRIYDLDRGTTEALVQKGFVEDLVSRSSTDIEPSLLIDILRDQEAAVRLVFVVSFHNIGQELSGIMEVTAFAFLEFYEGQNDRVARSEKFFQCSLEPFVITWNSNADSSKGLFNRWLDSNLAIAMKEWIDHI